MHSVLVNLLYCHCLRKMTQAGSSGKKVSPYCGHYGVVLPLLWACKNISQSARASVSGPGPGEEQIDFVSSRSSASPWQAKQVFGFAAVGAKSEQAMVHSAPPPSSALFEVNPTISLAAVVVKLLGPEFWQNLESQRK